MSKIGNEITSKLRNDIRAKLNDIGAYVDNELPDYIMVMVANQKSRYQMKDDLSLFLGKNTDEFVDWLHESLKSIQEKVSSNENKETIGKKNKSGKQSNDVETSGLNEKALIEKEANKSGEEVNNNEQSTNEEQKVNYVSNSHNGKINDLRNGQHILSVPPSVNHFPEDSSMSNDKGDEQEVVLRLNDDTGDADELLQESPLAADDNNLKKTTLKLKTNITISVPKAKQEVNHVVDHKPPMSTIGAVVTHEPMFVDDDEEDVNTKSVSSVVKIKERKSSVPIDKQANKLLILKAVQEATQSVSGATKRKLMEDYTPTPIIRKRCRQTDFSLDPSDLRHYLKANRFQEIESNFTSDENEENHYRGQMESPKFIVTLDGVRKRFGQNNEEGVFIDDELTLGEEIDEEFVEIENSFEEKEQKDEDDKKVSSGKNKEKCKYWPSCKNGDECLYQHPNSPCKSFPNCRFGEKCLFIHPQCKYDNICAKPDCPFAHSSKKPTSGSKAITLGTVIPPCKFYPNCTNTTCPFIHPKPCIFGSKCRNSNCKYSHPFNFFGSNLPKPHQLKWKAKEHISERKFSEEDSEKVTVIESHSTN